TGVAVWLMRPAPAPRERLRASINLPSTMRLDQQNPPFAFSPDGRTLAIVAVGAGGKPMLHLRRLDARDTQPLAGTEGASYPFWSPDGRYLGFFAERKLKKIPATGGAVVSLCDVVDGRGASWSRTGVIVFSPGPFGGLSMVGEAGGAPTPLTTTDQPSVTHRLPWFLPDGKRLLYFIGTISGDKKNGVHVLDLETKKDTPLLDVDSRVAYAAPGWISFVRDQNVLAQRFDASTLKLQGEAIPIAEGIHYNAARWSGAYAISDQGALVYQSGAASLRSQFTWFDYDGKKLESVGEPGPIGFPSLSPDGKRVAFGRFASTSGQAEIWVLDLTRGVSSRFSFGQGGASFPLWSPDSQRVAFTDGDGQILIKRADGTGDAETLVGTHDRLRNPSFWTPDGAQIFFRMQDPKTGLDLHQLATGGSHEVKDLLVTPANETDPSLSPDGRLLAYRSDESGGTMQLFIVPYPADTGGKWQVTNGGAENYEWSPDGRRIIYEAADGKMYSVGVQRVNGVVELGAATPFFGGETAPNAWALGRDGKRLLGIEQINEGSTAPLELDLDWSAGIVLP
ncbi:MAG TPA: hypothetical protein VJV75_00865, partial [Candidatus Polarisedimenticolia bacterium]|nr:hypothetical protein [Candidatus Polarisedimenticolia bacterium]